jgi:acyl carrier protein
MDMKQEVKQLLNDVLNLNGRATSFVEDTPLLGSIPELDSMAVISLISAIEERFQCAVEDDEIDGAVFATFGSLVQFIQSKSA